MIKLHNQMFFFTFFGATAWWSLFSRGFDPPGCQSVAGTLRSGPLPDIPLPSIGIFFLFQLPFSPGSNAELSLLPELAVLTPQFSQNSGLLLSSEKNISSLVQPENSPSLSSLELALLYRAFGKEGDALHVSGLGN